LKKLAVAAIILFLVGILLEIGLLFTTSDEELLPPPAPAPAEEHDGTWV
jgi:hypothetical protein